MARQRVHQYLGRRLDELETALAGGDGDEISGLLRETLGWLYSLEEIYRKTMGSTYFDARKADPDGQASGGLVWARNLAVHQDSEFHRSLTRPIDHINLPGLGPVPLSMVTVRDGSGEFTSPSAEMKIGNEYDVWPTRKELPEPDQPDRHGREAMYDDHVSGRELIRPLQRAIAFFDRLEARVPDPATTKYQAKVSVEGGRLVVTFPSGHPDGPA